MKNYYDILGLKYPASKDEIKKAFYRLAHIWHPDKKTGNEKKFKEINNAYQMLMKQGSDMHQHSERPVYRWGNINMTFTDANGRHAQSYYDPDTGTWVTIRW